MKEKKFIKRRRKSPYFRKCRGEKKRNLKYSQFIPTQLMLELKKNTRYKMLIEKLPFIGHPVYQQYLEIQGTINLQPPSVSF